MATYATAELLQRWKQQTLTQEQAIGQLLQHIDELKPWFHRFDAVLVVVGLIAVAWFVRKQLKARRALS